MSIRNTPDQKFLRRAENLDRKQKSHQLKIPFLGVIVRATDVRRHRYLRNHGFPFSSRLANVVIRRDLVTGIDDTEIQAILN